MRIDGPTPSPAERHGWALRRAWGGRLRTFRPRLGKVTHLESIRKALVRGELAVNGLNRWRLLDGAVPATGWTFVEPGQTASVARAEIQVARREFGTLRTLVVDELTVEETADCIERRDERPDLLLVLRDWSQHATSCPAYERLLSLARKSRIVVHVIAALGTNSLPGDAFFCDAKRQWRLLQEPLLRPLPSTSKIERQFGKALALAGLNPIPQRPVAHYFLDFAIVGQSGEPSVRLDIEVDGRYWHEELSGRRRPADHQRDEVVRRLGWRPVRIWDDEIKEDEARCVERVYTEANSTIPRSNWQSQTRELP